MKLTRAMRRLREILRAAGVPHMFAADDRGEERVLVVGPSGRARAMRPGTARAMANRMDAIRWGFGR